MLVDVTCKAIHGNKNNDTETTLANWNRWEIAEVAKRNSWGGAKVVLNTKFDDWWEERWITLFGYEGTRDGAFIDGQKPRYYLSTNRPKADGIRYALMVYQNRHRGGTLEIAEWIKSYEQKKSQLRSGIFWVEETFELQSRIGRYRKNAHKILENVSVGVFP